MGKGLRERRRGIPPLPGPECGLAQDPIPATHGIEEAVGLLRDTRERIGLCSFGADVRHVAVNGDVAFAERVDHLKRADGSLIFSLPVTGVFEFDRDGRIAVWREYFDSAPIMKVIAAASET